jgi:hypothetical protein
VIGGKVLDPSAVVRIVTGDSIYGQALVSVAIDVGIVLDIPAAALATAWMLTPPAAYPALDALCELSVAVLDPLDSPAAREAGLMAAGHDGTVTGRTSLGTAHAITAARDRGWPVVTADRELVLALEPRADLESLP